MNQHDIQRALDAFAQDPRAAMGRVPEKRGADGHVLEKGRSLFAPADIASGRYIEHRDSVRRKFSKMVDGVIVSLEDVLPGRAAIEAEDRAEDLVDAFKYDKP